MRHIKLEENRVITPFCPASRAKSHAPQRIARWSIVIVSTIAAGMSLTTPDARSEPINHIAVDGAFSDWDAVPSRFDPLGASAADMHPGTNIPDVHDTRPGNQSHVPEFVDHPDVDIREFKFTHDEHNLYAYFKATGNIGATQAATAGDPGRYYVIVTIDVDNDDATGYWLHEGGYFPSSDGYDMNMEAEFYGGTLNTAHYLSHDALGNRALLNDFVALTSGEYVRGNSGPYTPGYVQPDSGNYEDYTQWVYHANDTLTLVEDRGPVVPGIMSVAVSPDGHEIEMAAPFRGFMPDMAGNPNIALGQTLDISFSLEASGELAPDGRWASDTGDPIIGYYLGGAPAPEPSGYILLIGSALSFMQVRRRRVSNSA